MDWTDVLLFQASAAVFVHQVEANGGLTFSGRMTLSGIAKESEALGERRN
jgi:hypothetical protein